MSTDRTVRIAGTSTKATFTQRGSFARNGFIRMFGMTISGVATTSYDGEKVFWAQGINRSALFNAINAE